MSNVLPFLSVIIPTYKRGKCLLNTLQNLLVQDYPSFEIIVADQTEHYDSELWCRLVKLQKDVKITYLRLAQPSVTKAKNIAIAKAQGELILILDDDLSFGPDLLASHARRYQQVGVDGVGGRIVEHTVPKKHLFSASFGQFNFVGEPNTDSTGVTQFTKVAVTPGGNLSFSKQVWERIGGFDENFVANALNEDSDFCLRMVRVGYKLWFDPVISVSHQRAPQGGTRAFGDRLNWFEQLFANNLYFFLKHYPFWKLPFFFIYRVRQEIACIFKYGHFSPRAIITPTRGYWLGWRRYKCSRS